MISNSLFVFLGEFLGKLLTKARNLSGVPTIKNITVQMARNLLVRHQRQAREEGCKVDS